MPNKIDIIEVLTEVVDRIEDVLYEDVTLAGVLDQLIDASNEADDADEADLEEASDIVKNVASQIDTAKDELFAAIDLIRNVIHRAKEEESA